MRDPWIQAHVGDEATVRPGFEDELAETLQSAWAAAAGAPPTPAHTATPSGPTRRTRVAIWAAAAAVLLAGGALVVTQSGRSHVTSNTAVETSTPGSVDVTTVSSTPEPTTTELSTTALPTTAPTTTPPASTSPATVVAHTPEEQNVLTYLTALAEGRYDDAAKLLGEGGLEWESRADLRPLGSTDNALNSLPAALRTWCESPALCRVPTTLASNSSGVVATFTVGGVTRSSLFVGGTFEGSPLVQGLPLRLPPAGTPFADTVQCPVDDVQDSVFADLEPDGWDELVTMIRAPGSDLVTVAVCGTTATIEPFVGTVVGAPGAPARVFVLSGGSLGSAADQLLLTSDFPDGYTARVLAVTGGRLIETGQTVEQSVSAGTSFGCAVFPGDSVGRLVDYTYRLIGGTELSNSTSLEYEMTESLPGGRAGLSASGSIPLPAETARAFEIIAGYCGALPVQTG